MKKTKSTRINRLTFLLAQIIVIVLLIVLCAFVLLFSAIAAPNSTTVPDIAVYMILLVWLGCTVLSVRNFTWRLRDLDASPWWALLYFVPVASLGLAIVAYFIPGTDGKNRFGSKPNGVELYKVYAFKS